MLIARRRQRVRACHDITFGFVGKLEDAPSDRQMLDNGIFPELSLKSGDAIRTVDSPLSIAGASKTVPGVAPERGQHTGEVLAELGYGEEEIRQLRDCGALG